MSWQQHVGQQTDIAVCPAHLSSWPSCSIASLLPGVHTLTAFVCWLSCRSARLSLPLIKSAALLITHADFAGVPASASLDPGAAASGDAATAAVSDAPVASSKAATDADSGSSSFAWGVLQHLKAELKGCGDVLKLLEGVSLLAQLACVPDCSASAIQTVMVMLVNRYPKVRHSWCWAGCQAVSSVCCRTPVPLCCEQYAAVLAGGRLAVVSSCRNGLRVGPLGAGDYNQHVQHVTVCVFKKLLVLCVVCGVMCRCAGPWLSSCTCR